MKKKKDNIVYFLLLMTIVLVISCNRQTKVSQNVNSEHQKQDTVYIDSLLYDNDTIAIYKIDSITFFKLKVKFPASKDTLPYIFDLEEAKKLLKGRVVFGGYNEETSLVDSTINDGMIFQVRFSNDVTVFGDEQQYSWSDIGFVRYYPTEDILLCEGGHSSDFSFDLKNGMIGADSVGNPEYIYYSPNKKYRLNGWFPGQECSEYFIQKLEGQMYKVLANIPLSFSEFGFDFCTIKDVFWIDDNTLLFRNFYYGFSDDKRLGFFRLKIK